MKGPAFWTRIAGFLALLCAFSIYGPAAGDVAARVASQSWMAWAGALGLYMLALWCSALRLRTIAGTSQIDMTTAESFLMILKSTTLNTFLLSGAGEIYKASVMASRNGRMALSGGIVAFERLFGALTQLAFGLSMLIVFQRLDLILPGTGATLAVTALALCIVWGVVTFHAARLPVLADVRKGMFSVFRSATSVSVLLVSSVLLIFCMIGSTWLLAYGAGLEIAFSEFMYAVPLVTFATLVPVTFGGIGVREAGYLWMLKSSLVTGADCVALGLSQYLVLLAAALLGAALFFVGTRMPFSRGAD